MCASSPSSIVADHICNSANCSVHCKDYTLRYKGKLISHHYFKFIVSGLCVIFLNF